MYLIYYIKYLGFYIIVLLKGTLRSTLFYRWGKLRPRHLGDLPWDQSPSFGIPSSVFFPLSYFFPKVTVIVVRVTGLFWVITLSYTNFFSFFLFYLRARNWIKNKPCFITHSHHLSIYSVFVYVIFWKYDIKLLGLHILLKSPRCI